MLKIVILIVALLISAQPVAAQFDQILKGLGSSAGGGISDAKG